MFRATQALRTAVAISLLALSLLAPAAIAAGSHGGSGSTASASSVPACNHNGQHDCYTHSACSTGFEYFYVWNVYPSNLRSATRTSCGVA